MGEIILAHYRKQYTYNWAAGAGSAGSVNCATVDVSNYAGGLAFAFSYTAYTGTIQPYVSMDGTQFLRPHLLDVCAGTTGRGTAIICAALTGGTVFTTTYEVPWHSAYVIITGNAGAVTLDLVAAVI